ncbi:MAG: oligosaccharide repeat unit polymerase [bacterium]
MNSARVLKPFTPSTFPKIGAFLIAGFLIAAMSIPFIYWLELHNPSYLQTWQSSWPDPVAIAMIIGTSILLLAFVIVWIWRARVIDIISLTLVWEVLVAVGYFWLDQTASRVQDMSEAILRASTLVIFVNSLGLLILLVTMCASYFFCSWTNWRLSKPPRPEAELDARLASFFRWTSPLVALAMAAPMLATGVIPAFAENVREARMIALSSSLARPFFNAAVSLMPFYVSVFACLILRSYKRLFSLDLFLLIVLVAILLLTGIRYPLATAMLVGFTLITMQRRFAPHVLYGVLLLYIFVFTFLTGWTSLMRDGDASWRSPQVIQESFNEAFTGDNIIDLRDGSWVMSKWDFHPLMGKTYLGGFFSMVPSGIFPQKKDWHLGLTCIRIIGWDPTQHFGLRTSFFGEAFLNFGLAGVFALALFLGATYGILLRQIFLTTQNPSIWRAVILVIFIQMLAPFSNTSDAFTSWAMIGLFLLIRFFVEARWQLPKRTLVSFRPVFGIK